MSRWYQKYTTTEILAIGIEGNRSSFCGAIKRFQRYGIQSNNPLSLKEQCARHIVLIKNDQIKWFINAYLPSHLFKYVTKDLFNLQREEFALNYAEDFDLCDACSTDNYKLRRTNKCRCPKMERAMDELNKYFSQRMNSKQFELIYHLPNCEDDYSNYSDELPLFFIYLLPCLYHHQRTSDDHSDDMGPYQGCHLIEQISIEDKLLFVDLMRFFGPFETKHEQPELILYTCHDQEL